MYSRELVIIVCTTQQFFCPPGFEKLNKYPQADKKSWLSQYVGQYYTHIKLHRPFLVKLHIQHYCIASCHWTICVVLFFMAHLPIFNRHKFVNWYPIKKDLKTIIYQNVLHKFIPIFKLVNSKRKGSDSVGRGWFDITTSNLLSYPQFTQKTTWHMDWKSMARPGRGQVCCF